MIPTRHDEATEAINEWIEGAAGGMLKRFQVAGGGIEAVCAGNGGMPLVFVEADVHAVVWLVAHEDDSSVGGVAGSDVVAVGGLVGDFDDDGRCICVGNDGVEVSEFVELPVEGGGVGGACGRADGHAEQNFFAAPMDGGI